jgi:endonuclease III
MKTRAQQIESILDSYFPDPQIPLYHLDPFTLLVAVMLSAQCQDARVNKVTHHLFKLAKTPSEMAALPLPKLEALLRPLGLYRTKAKNLLALSHALLERFYGKVPKTLKALESLPGVGHKTASVVLVQAFHIPAFPVDTHIFRSAHRFGLSQGKTIAKVEEDLKRLFPKKRWAKIHLQLILFARQFCPARGHISKNCPICSLC